jgi:hypothetical protein
MEKGSEEGERQTSASGAQPKKKAQHNLKGRQYFRIREFGEYIFP